MISLPVTIHFLKPLRHVFPTLISVSNAYLSVVQCRAGLCEVKQLCVDRQAVLILFDALSLSWQGADCICLRQFGSVDRETAEASVFIWASFPGRWCPLCTEAALNTHAVHHAHSCRTPCRCSPEWTVTFNNSSDLVRRVQNESGGKRGRLRFGACRCFLTKTAAKWNLVITEWLLFLFCFNNSECCLYSLSSTVMDPRHYKWRLHKTFSPCLFVMRSSNIPVYILLKVELQKSLLADIQ